MPAPPDPLIVTPRLRLRTWSPADREPFARLNADPAVMRHFPSTLTRAESAAAVDHIEAHHRLHGFTLYAADLIAESRFIGFIGLLTVPFEAPFTPAVEIGWRLDSAYWNRGLATEGACAVAEYAFQIGMRHCPDEDFENPRLPPGHPLRRHVLYRLARNAVS